MIENIQKKQTQSLVPFLTIWSGQAISLIGSQVAQFGLIWWLTELTGSATVLALASLAGLLPQVLLGPLAGAYVDRWNRRTIMIVADSLGALAALWLAYSFWIGAAQVWHIYLLLAARALGAAFQWPAMQASTTLMVPEKHLARVAGFNQMLEGLLSIIGPPLGALALSLWTMDRIMMIDVITALFAVIPLCFIHIPQPAESPSHRAGARSSIWVDVGAGLSYIWRWPGMRWLLIMAMAINFILNPTLSLTPILVTDYFGGGAAQLGWMQSGWGVGVVLGGLTLGIWGGFQRRIFTSLLGLTLMGLGFLGVGLSGPASFWPAVVALSLAGFMMPITNGPIFALLQATIDPGMQGRVFTVIMSLSAVMTPLGLIVAGPVADAVGVQSWYWVSGLVCLLLGLAAYFIPAIIDIEQNHSQAISSG
jgi:DHA3 family macrolide efflux protein-like MFS transporter